MTIPLPPDSGTGLENAIKSCVRELNNYFGSERAKEGAEWGFDKKGLQDYFSHVKWFEHVLPHCEAILNVGCSFGRESFALMRHFKATEVVGLDTRSKVIDFAYRKGILNLKTLSQQITKFNNPVSGLGWTEQYTEEFRVWWREEVCNDLRQAVENGIAPEFTVGDVSESGAIPRPDEYFDMVYCCNVLDELVNERKDWMSAIQNMAVVVKPEIGRVVVVGATKRDSAQNKHTKHFISLDEFEPHFRDAELELIEVAEAPSLGFIDWPATDPKGHIYKRR